MVSDVKLKPCPFCGGDPELKEHFGDWSVECNVCHCGTPWFEFISDGKEKAVEMWNVRADHGNAAALLEALRALRDASRDFYNQILNSKYSEILDKYTCVKQGFPAVLDLRSAFPMANYALSAPHRNCDAMPWRKAWDEWRAKHHPQNPQTFNESYEATVAFMEWFTASSAEKGATA